MGEKDTHPEPYHVDTQPHDVRRLVQQFNSESSNHVTPESMALTSQTSVDSNKKEKKKKKVRDKDKKAAEKLIKQNSEKPLRSSRSTPNHIEVDYLKHTRDHRIRSTTSTIDPRERGACFNCLRNALHCYNIVVLIMGVGTLGVGIWLLVTDFSVREISVIIDSNLFEIGTYFILAGGGLIAILAFCGCCGTMREDRCILGFYGVVLAMVFFALIVGGALAFTFRNDIAKDIKKKLQSSIQHHYGVDVRTNATNKLITDAWDSMQRKLECCGSDGGKDSYYSWGIYKLRSKWYADKLNKHPMVPESCCVEGGNKMICQGNDRSIMGPPNYGPGKGFAEIHYINEHLHLNGCYEKMIGYIQQYSLILGIVAVSVPVFMIIGSVIAFCLCCRVTKSDSFDEEDL